MATHLDSDNFLEEWWGHLPRVSGDSGFLNVKGKISFFQKQLPGALLPFGKNVDSLRIHPVMESMYMISSFSC